MTPSGNMPDPVAQQQSFSLATIVPQTAKLNRGVWEWIESAVRTLVKRQGKATCLPTSRATTIGGASTRPSATSYPSRWNGMRANPRVREIRGRSLKPSAEFSHGLLPIQRQKLASGERFKGWLIWRLDRRDGEMVAISSSTDRVSTPLIVYMGCIQGHLRKPKVA